jgi:hypothetical protein
MGCPAPTKTVCAGGVNCVFVCSSVRAGSPASFREHELVREDEAKWAVAEGRCEPSGVLRRSRFSYSPHLQLRLSSAAHIC